MDKKLFSLSQPNWKLDHVAHAVNNLQHSIDWYEKTFGFNLIERESLPDYGIEIAFLEFANSMIELISPLPGPNKVRQFIEQRGPGLHHICFLVNSVATELVRLSSLGIELIDKTPRKGSRNMQIAFLHPKSTQGVLIELCNPS